MITFLQDVLLVRQLARHQALMVELAVAF